ncbi:MAG: MTH1187 family thiamine-binding protein [Thermoanaerobaculia bacterium]|jgi:uncharacterized protein (TIGR00106 family)
MKATAEIQIIPLGVGSSVRKQVMRAHEIIKDAGIGAELQAWGTNVEGEIDDILAAVKRVHETLHAEGTVRIASFVKIGTRTDKEPTLKGKMF